MQKLIAKYGLAAHLALTAVAPLFLFPFFDAGQVARVLLWLSLAAALWTLLEPSVHVDESLHGARRRVARVIVRDPLFWLFIVVTFVAGIRALNGGVSLAYDAETAKWALSPASLPYFPCSVDEAGFLPFAAAVSASVLIVSCRHSLGRSARMAFLLFASVLAGVAAVVAVSLLSAGNGQVQIAASGEGLGYSFVGSAFGLHLLGGTVAAAAVFERSWKLMMPFVTFSVGGTAAGLFVFAPSFTVVAFACAELLLLILVFVFACFRFKSAGEFKLLVVIGLSFVLGYVAVISLVPNGLLAREVAPFAALSFFSDEFMKLRTVLSGIAFKTWLSHLWIGTGIGSYVLDFRFNASPGDWLLAPRGALAASNGWLNLLAERGVLGAALIGLPLGFLCFSFGKRLIRWIPLGGFPHPACWLPLLSGLVLAVTGLFDCSFLRADVLAVCGAFFAIAQHSFPARKVG